MRQRPRPTLFPYTTLFRSFAAERLDRWYGVYPALVVDVRDPDGQGRVRVSLPWAPDSGGAGYEAWARQDRKSTRLNSSHVEISYAVFCLTKKRERARRATA